MITMACPDKKYPARRGGLEFGLLHRVTQWTFVYMTRGNFKWGTTCIWKDRYALRARAEPMGPSSWEVCSGMGWLYLFFAITFVSEWWINGKPWHALFYRLVLSTTAPMRWNHAAVQISVGSSVLEDAIRSACNLIVSVNECDPPFHPLFLIWRTRFYNIGEGVIP